MDDKSTIKIREVLFFEGKWGSYYIVNGRESEPGGITLRDTTGRRTGT